MPLVTKIFLVTNLVVGASITFGLLKMESLALLWPNIWEKFEVWRLFTCFFAMGPFSLNFAIHTYVMYQNCKRYEANPFNTGAGGTTPDFLWLVLVCGMFLLVVAYYFTLYVLGEPIMYSIMYVWCRRAPDEVQSMFGFKFKALYLPWVYMLIRIVMGGAITEPLIGVAVGHLYYFLVEILPVTPGYNLGPLVYTPKFCIQFVSYLNSAVPAVAPQAFAPRQQAGAVGGAAPAGRAFPQMGVGGYQWGGGGRALGTR
jgi:hypothetical protein